MSVKGGERNDFLNKEQDVQKQNPWDDLGDVVFAGGEPDFGEAPMFAAYTEKPSGAESAPSEESGEKGEERPGAIIENFLRTKASEEQLQDPAFYRDEKFMGYLEEVLESQFDLPENGDPPTDSPFYKSIFDFGSQLAGHGISVPKLDDFFFEQNEEVSEAYSSEIETIRALRSEQIDDELSDSLESIPDVIEKYMHKDLFASYEERMEHKDEFVDNYGRDRLTVALEDITRKIKDAEACGIALDKERLQKELSEKVISRLLEYSDGLDPLTSDENSTYRGISPRCEAFDKIQYLYKRNSEYFEDNSSSQTMAALTYLEANEKNPGNDVAEGIFREFFSHGRQEIEIVQDGDLSPKFLSHVYHSGDYRQSFQYNDLIGFEDYVERYNKSIDAFMSRYYSEYDQKRYHILEHSNRGNDVFEAALRITDEEMPENRIKEVKYIAQESNNAIQFIGVYKLREEARVNAGEEDLLPEREEDAKEIIEKERRFIDGLYGEWRFGDYEKKGRISSFGGYEAVDQITSMFAVQNTMEEGGESRKKFTTLASAMLELGVKPSGEDFADKFLALTYDCPDIDEQNSVAISRLAMLSALEISDGGEKSLDFSQVLSNIGEYNSIFAESKKHCPCIEPKALEELALSSIGADVEYKGLEDIDLEGRSVEDIGEDIIGSADLMADIYLSNSQNIQEMKQELVRAVLDSSRGEDNKLNLELGHERIAKIEEVFLRNNLPTAAKHFVAFCVMYPPESIIGALSEESSPTLLEISKHENAGEELQRLFLKDILKCSLDSNSRDMRDYLEGARDGQALMDDISSGVRSFSDLSAKEQADLRKFVDHACATYSQLDANREKQTLYIDEINQDSLNELSELWGAGSRYSVADRMVRSFMYPLGIHGVNEAIGYMNRAHEEMEAKNSNPPQKLFIKEGDIVKNVGGRYLDSILENGSVSKEFLGGYQRSDNTPFDTDVTIVGKDAPLEQCMEVQGNPNGNYGGVWLITHFDEEHIKLTRSIDKTRSTETVDPNDPRIELFSTPVVSDSHYGIRTGYGKKYIDAIVIGDIVIGDEFQAEYLDKTAFRIVKSGDYIPVYDKKTGDLIFSREDYDKLRERLSGNMEYNMDEYRMASEADFAEDVRRNGGRDNETARGAMQENIRDTNARDMTIRRAVISKLPGMRFRNHIDHDLTPGFIEVSSTGSTGRGTNVEGDGDFDYIFRIDRKIYNNPDALAALSSQVRGAFVSDENSTLESADQGGIRYKGVMVEGSDERFDVDITFVPRTDKVTYATEDSIRTYLSAFDDDPTKKARVVENIIAAKKMFKAAGCYKPKHGREVHKINDTPIGGLGGVGVENWILQNGGSLTAAAKDFLSIAGVLGEDGKPIPGAAGTFDVNGFVQPSANLLSFEEFKTKYKLWDLGANHMAESKGTYPHDEFIQGNINEEGYHAIVHTLVEYLAR